MSETEQALTRRLSHTARQIELLCREPALLAKVSRLIEREDLARIINAVCDAFKVSRAELLGTGRPRRIADARQAAHALVYETGLSYSATAELFRCDHTTIIHSRQACAAKRETDRQFRAAWDRTQALLGEQAGPEPVCAAGQGGPAWRHETK